MYQEYLNYNHQYPAYAPHAFHHCSHQYSAYAPPAAHLYPTCSPPVPTCTSPIPRKHLTYAPPAAHLCPTCSPPIPHLLPAITPHAPHLHFTCTLLYQPINLRETQDREKERVRDAPVLQTVIVLVFFHNYA